MNQVCFISGAGQALQPPPAEFVEVRTPALGVPVVVAAQGIVGILSGRSTCDRQRWRITWFNRHFWRVEHKWFARSQFEVIGVANCAADVNGTAAQFA